MRLTRRQAQVLGVVAAAPAAPAAADVAADLRISEAAARSVLAALEHRGLLDRTYTGHHRRSRFAFVATRAGAARAAALFADPDVRDEDDHPGGGPGE